MLSVLDQVVRVGHGSPNDFIEFDFTDFGICSGPHPDLGADEVGL